MSVRSPGDAMIDVPVTVRVSCGRYTDCFMVQHSLALVDVHCEFRNSLTSKAQVNSVKSLCVAEGHDLH